MGQSEVSFHIDDLSQRLSAWLSQLLPDAAIDFPNENAAVSRSAKSAPPKKTQISAWFRSIFMEKLDRATLNPERSFVVTYALEVRAKTAFECHRAYSEIYFHAHDDHNWQVESGTRGTSHSVSIAGALPLYLSAKIPRLSVNKTAPPVKGRIKVEMTGLGRIYGQVTSAQGVPIPKAYVEAPTLGRRLTTNNEGQFVIDGAPTAGVIAISVTARGRIVHLSVDAANAKHLVVIMAMEEENA